MRRNCCYSFEKARIPSGEGKKRRMLSEWRKRLLESLACFAIGIGIFVREYFSVRLVSYFVVMVLALLYRAVEYFLG